MARLKGQTVVMYREYCDYRVEKGTDGDIESENFYFVNTEGQERLVIRGGTEGDWSHLFRSVRSS